MTPERKNRLARQLNLGRDNGMRLKLTWESGFTVTVHSWEAAAAVLGRIKAGTLRQYWYKSSLFDEHLKNGYECQNPDTYAHERCYFIMEQNARRGPPTSEAAQKRREEMARIKVEQRKLKLEKAELELQRLRNQHD